MYDKSYAKKGVNNLEDVYLEACAVVLASTSIMDYFGIWEVSAVGQLCSSSCSYVNRMHISATARVVFVVCC